MVIPKNCLLGGNRISAQSWRNLNNEIVFKVLISFFFLNPSIDNTADK